MQSAPYFTQPLNTGVYHLTEITFFLSVFALWLILYKQNQVAIWAKQNPMRLIPPPRPQFWELRRYPRRARFKAWLKFHLAKFILPLLGESVFPPLRRSVVSTWRNACSAAKASRRVL